MTPSGIYQVVHDRARAAGLPAIHPHKLRHAFATSWLAEVGNENELMLVAGWKSRTMIDRYTRATAVERARVSAMLACHRATGYRPSIKGRPLWQAPRREVTASAHPYQGIED